MTRKCEQCGEALGQRQRRFCSHRCSGLFSGPKGGRPPALTEAQIKEIVRRRKLGEPFKVIANAVECEVLTARHYALKSGVKFNLTERRKAALYMANVRKQAIADVAREIALAKAEAKGRLW